MAINNTVWHKAGADDMPELNPWIGDHRTSTVVIVAFKITSIKSSVVFRGLGFVHQIRGKSPTWHIIGKDHPNDSIKYKVILWMPFPSLPEDEDFNDKSNK